MKFMETAKDFLVWPATFLVVAALVEFSFQKKLGMVVDLPGQQTHAETLGGPEGEHNVVADKQTGFGCSVGVGNSH